MRVVIGIGCLVAVLASTPARADDVDAAAKAFAQAQQTMLKGDPARAADLYELADHLAPSPAALRNAARARYAAGHLATAATLAAEMLTRDPSDADSRAVAEGILSKVTPHLGQLDIRCDPRCDIQLGERAASLDTREHHVIFVNPGAFTVVARFGDRGSARAQLAVRAGHAERLSLVPPARTALPAHVRSPDSKPAARGSHGIGRGWVLGTALVTAGLGAAAAYEGRLTLASRDEVRRLVAAGETADATARYNLGRDQQQRTNLLLGATAVAGVATLTCALLANWHGGAEHAALSVVPSRAGATVVFGGAF
ncbi:MAG: hypothetical protein K8W52_27435 [Deltaproteobacteria bacterium]|nr:hypothetical protein [Deltaproteobacteria bacterium]